MFFFLVCLVWLFCCGFFCLVGWSFFLFWFFVLFCFCFGRMILEGCCILLNNSLDLVKMKLVGLNVSQSEAKALRSCVCNFW